MSAVLLISLVYTWSLDTPEYEAGQNKTDVVASWINLFMWIILCTRVRFKFIFHNTVF